MLAAYVLWLPIIQAREIQIRMLLKEQSDQFS